MDNQQQPPVVNQEPAITNQKGPSSFLTILLSILLILACLIAGFFAWQTQQLVAELRTKNEELGKLQQTLTQDPSPTPTPEPTEIASPSSTLLPDSSQLPVACTMDAKICPDGSAVGRIPPSCEFAPCPN